MNSGLRGYDAGQRDGADDNAEQHHQHGFLHRPE